MLTPVVITFTLLAVIFYVSKFLTAYIFLIFVRFTGSQHFSMVALTALLFPGTIVHELAHLFTAEILRVPTGKLSLEPQIPHDLSTGKNYSSVVFGNVEIARTDPVRRYIIGLAPVFCGIILLSSIANFFIPLLESHYAQLLTGSALNVQDLLLTASMIYLFFSISNSMFSSPSDLKGFGAFLAVIILLGLGAYFLGIQFGLSHNSQQIVIRALGQINLSLGIILVTNLVLLSLIRIVLELFTPRLKRR